MSFILINALKESIKSYTIAANIAFATGKQTDAQRASAILQQINAIRLQNAIEAESREIFIEQLDIPAAPNTNTFEPFYFSKNDINYTICRMIAALENNVAISLENQGTGYKDITRNPVAWQQLMSDIQRTTPRGQQTLKDLPEILRFTENQALKIGVKGQNADGQIFIHGATIKDAPLESVAQDLEREFIDASGKTLYLPETQIVPIEFQFDDIAAGTPAKSANGNADLFSIKNQRTVLLTEVSLSAIQDARITLTDEGKNQLICNSIEMLGLAANCANPFTSFYKLPYPHLLRKGDRLKANIINGSLITGNELAADTLYYLTFRGITL